MRSRHVFNLAWESGLRDVVDLGDGDEPESTFALDLDEVGVRTTIDALRCDFAIDGVAIDDLGPRRECYRDRRRLGISVRCAREFRPRQPTFATFDAWVCSIASNQSKRQARRPCALT